MSWNLQLVSEIADLVRFGFKVFVLRLGEDKIEHSDAPLNVFDFVFPEVAKIPCRSGAIACGRRRDTPSRSLGSIRYVRVFLCEACARRRSRVRPNCPG